MNELSATLPYMCACARGRRYTRATHHRRFFVTISSRFCGSLSSSLPRALHYRIRIRGLIYSQRFISGIRRRRRAICSMISPSPPLLSLFPFYRILFRDFAFCHIKFDCTMGTRCGDGQILKHLPEI